MTSVDKIYRTSGMKGFKKKNQLARVDKESMDDEDEKLPESLNTLQTRSLKMSSSLKEKLRNCSRSFSSPVSGVHTLERQDKTALSITDHANLPHQEIPSELSLDYIKSCNDQDMLQKIYLSLKKDVAENEEKLGKLERIKHYRSKNRPEELIAVTERWLIASQESLRKLYEKLPENKASFQQFLNMLNVDCDIINYDAETDTFSH